MVFAVHAMGCVMAAEFNMSYVCPGFYPIAARDLAHAASLFALWKARRKLGPSASCGQLVLQEELANGAKFESGLLARKVSPERPTVSSSWSIVHEAASGLRQPGHSRRALHLWASSGIFRPVMSRLYHCKTQQRGDDAVVAIFSPPGIRRASFHLYRSAATRNR